MQTDLNNYVKPVNTELKNLVLKFKAEITPKNINYINADGYRIQLDNYVRKMGYKGRKRNLLTGLGFFYHKNNVDNRIYRNKLLKMFDEVLELIDSGFY